MGAELRWVRHGARSDNAKAEVGNAAAGAHLVARRVGPSTERLLANALVVVAFELARHDGKTTTANPDRGAGIRSEIRDPVNLRHAGRPAAKEVRAVVRPIGDRCPPTLSCAPSGRFEHEDVGATEQRDPAGAQPPQLETLEPVRDAPNWPPPIGRGDASLGRSRPRLLDIVAGSGVELGQHLTDDLGRLVRGERVAAFRVRDLRGEVLD